MKKTLVLLLGLLALSAPARPGCSYHQIFSSNYRASALDVAVDGSDLWTATSYGVALYDRSVDPPLPVSSLPLAGPTTAVFAANATAYVGSGSSVFVVRRIDRGLSSIAAVDVGGAVNDFLSVPPYLFVAASNGVTVLNLSNPLAPAIAGSRLATTNGGAFSLARKDSTMYAADGDATLDVYSIANPAAPQGLGAVPALARSTSVAVNADRIYVSDGTQTTIMAGSGASIVKIGTTGRIATTALAPVSLSVAYVAGNDRHIRAVDFTDPENPVILWEDALAFSGGTINRVSSIATTDDGRVYAAAGDAGLVTYDSRSFRSPYPIRSFLFGATRDVFSFGNFLVASGATSGMKIFTEDTNGALGFRKEWATDKTWSLHDGRSMRLLASASSTLNLYDLVPTTPIVISSALLRAPARSAVLTSTTVGYAVLSDKTLWKVDLSRDAAVATQVTVAATPSFIAAAGNALALADLNDDGTTTIRYFPTGDFSAAPFIATIEGAATSGITMSSAGTVAAVTFRGVSLADFSTSPSRVTVLPSSASAPANALQFVGSDLFVLRGSLVERWNVTSGTVAKKFDLPISGVAMHANSAAGSVLSVATDDGAISILTSGSTSQPAEVAASAESNDYFKKIVRGDSALFLFDGRRIDRSVLSGRGLPAAWQPVVSGASLVDFTVAGDHVVTLSPNGRIAMVDPSGREVGATQISEGEDATPLSIATLAGAVYVSISRGCTSGNCEKKTLVLDPRSAALTATAALTGQLVDFAMNGRRAYAIFDQPGELRVLDVTNPFIPALAVARPSEGDPVSIAVAPATSTVYALGRKLYAYSTEDLSKKGELLEDYVVDPTGRVAYVDQKVRIDGDCGIIVGRSFSPQAYSLSGGSGAVTFPTAGAAKSIVVTSGQLQILTDYSLEIWTSAADPKRRRPID